MATDAAHIVLTAPNITVTRAWLRDILYASSKAYNDEQEELEQEAYIPEWSLVSPARRAITEITRIIYGPIVSTIGIDRMRFYMDARYGVATVEVHDGTSAESLPLSEFYCYAITALYNAVTREYQGASLDTDEQDLYACLYHAYHHIKMIENGGKRSGIWYQELVNNARYLGNDIIAGLSSKA